MKDYEKLYKSQSVWKSIGALAVPSLVTILVMVIYNMADMFFIGQLGNTAMVAAVSIVSPVFSLIMALATMIGAGGSTLIANAFGAGDKEKAGTVSAVSFYSSLFIGILLTPLLLLFRNPLLSLLGTTEEMWDYSLTYLSLLAVGTPFMMLSVALGNIVRSEGAVKEGLIGNLAGTVTNIVLDPIFILGFRWGVAGAAIATVIGNIVATVMYLAHIHRHALVVSVRWKDAMRGPSLIFSIIALGLPNAVSTFLSGFASTFSNQLLSTYGTGAIAAMAAAGKTNMLTGMVMIGISAGCQPLLSYNVGSGDHKRTKEILKDLTILSIGLGVFFAAFCFIFRGPIIGLFLKEESVKDMAMSLVPFLMIGSPLLGIYYVSTAYLQARKKASAAILTSVLRQGIILIPMLYILHSLFGFTGIAAAHAVADAAASVLSLVIVKISCREKGNAEKNDDKIEMNDKKEKSAAA